MTRRQLLLAARHTMRQSLRDDDPSADTALPACDSDGTAEDYFGLRIAAVFIILITSLLGACLPVFLARTSSSPGLQRLFFVAKYFGSGVILATAWMHLLSPAVEELGDPCVTAVLPPYDWAMGIALMTVMAMFLVELVVSNYNFGSGHSHDHGHSGHNPTKESTSEAPVDRLEQDDEATAASKTKGQLITSSPTNLVAPRGSVNYPPGNQDHYGHSRNHVEGDSHAAFAGQLTAIFILEFGVIFHSIFIGLTLATTDNFIILFIVIIFHQTFEGLGLGARLGTAVWPKDRRRYMPYLLGLLYAISTPLAIGVGIGVRASLDQSTPKAKIINGVFDAISGGILMYTALVELLAHEFMFNPEMRQGGLREQLKAYLCVAVGAGLMAVLAEWA